MPRNTRRGAPKNTQVEQADNIRSLYDWGKLPQQALRLKCNSYALVEQGSKTVLQQCLYTHFHPRQSSTTPSTDVSVEIAELRSLIFDLQKQNNQSK